MVVTVNIPDELVAAAKAHGLPLKEYVQEILAGLAGNGKPQTQEDIRASLDSLAQFSDKIPPLPKTISRDWIYQDHD